MFPSFQSNDYFFFNSPFPSWLFTNIFPFTPHIIIKIPTLNSRPKSKGRP